MGKSQKSETLLCRPPSHVGREGARLICKGSLNSANNIFIDPKSLLFFFFFFDELTKKS